MRVSALSGWLSCAGPATAGSASPGSSTDSRRRREGQSSFRLGEEERASGRLSLFRSAIAKYCNRGQQAAPRFAVMGHDGDRFTEETHGETRSAAVVLSLEGRCSIHLSYGWEVRCLVPLASAPKLERCWLSGLRWRARDVFARRRQALASSSAANRPTSFCW
jgi:hypothetical protein